MTSRMTGATRRAHQRLALLVLGVGLSAFGLPALLPAQQRPYSLAALIDSARHSLPLLLSQDALVGSARAGVTDARHGYLPQFRVTHQLNVGTDNAVPGIAFPLGTLPSMTSGVRAGNRYDLSSGSLAAVYGEFELFDFGARSARVSSAEAALALQRADRSQHSYLLAADIARLYFRLIKEQSRVTVEQQNVDRYTEAYQIVRALTASGIRPEADSSQASAELSAARLNLTRAVGAVAQLQAELSALTGIDGRRFTVDTTVLRYPEPAFDSLSPGPIAAAHPLLEYYLEQQQVRRAAQRVADKSNLPKVLLSASAWGRGSSITFDDAYRGLGTGFGLDRFNYGAGIAVSYDLSNIVHRSDKIAVNRFLTTSADYDLKQQELSLRTTAVEANQAIRTAESALTELPIQLAAARATYEQKLAQYRAGLISLVDLTNAAFVLYRSQSDRLDAVAQWYLAQLDRAQAAGTLDPFVRLIR